VNHVQKSAGFFGGEQKVIRDSLVPVQEPTWNMFEVNHQKPATTEEKIGVKEYISNQTGNKNGLYVYKDENDRILYLGKGKPLKGRLYCHYCESFEQVKGDRT
jgi:hypothetical protein